MYVVTGGAGFIGSALVRKLNDLGIDDILIVDFLGTTEKWRNLNGKRYLDYVEGDKFRQQIARTPQMGPIEAVIHMGACSTTTERNAAYMMDNNFTFSCELVSWAAARGARIIYASSAATYGDGAQGFDDDDARTDSLRPLNVYGYSKLAFDQWVLKRRPAKTTGLKFFNVFGPNEYHKEDQASVIYKSFHQIRDQGSISLFRSYKDEYKDGEQLRDFIYVKDCMDVVAWLLEHPDATGIFNLGTGKARSWNDLARAVFAALNKPEKINYVEMPEVLRGKYQYFTEAKMEKLRKAGYSAEFTSLEDAVADYVRNYLRADEYL